MADHTPLHTGWTRPAHQMPPRRLLILLHGVGGNEHSLQALAKQVPADVLVLCPRAPRQLATDQFGWFGVQFTAQGPVIQANEAEQSRQQLIALVQQTQQEHGIAPSQTVIAGFSQGGIMSASVALSAPECVAGFGLLAGRILPELAPHLASPARLTQLQGLILHGEQDDKLPLSWALRAAQWLEALGVHHRLQRYPVGHALTWEMQQTLLQWFDQVTTPA